VVIVGVALPISSSAGVIVGVPLPISSSAGVIVGVPLPISSSGSVVVVVVAGGIAVAGVGEDTVQLTPVS